MIALEANGNSLADAPETLDAPTVQRRERRLEASQQKGMRNPRGLQRGAQQHSLQGTNVSSNVRQLGHRAEDSVDSDSIPFMITAQGADMFIGHFGLALAAKKAAPKTSLGTLMLAAGFVDVLWPFFLLLGWEHVRIDPGNTAVTPLDFYDYPISHSLVAGFGWAILFGAVYYAVKRYQRGAVLVALLVLSHWVLDFVTHRADLPLLPVGGPKMGLGLWNHLTAALVVEIAIFCGGLWIYTRVTQAKDRIGHWGLVSLMALLFIVYFANIFGPPPPSVQAIALFGPISLLLFAWPYWIDRHRRLVEI